VRTNAHHLVAWPHEEEELEEEDDICCFFVPVLERVLVHFFFVARAVWDAKLEVQPTMAISFIQMTFFPAESGLRPELDLQFQPVDRSGSIDRAPVE
jgi:hypothetical protein